MVAFVGALTVAGLLHMMYHNFRLPKCCFALRKVCCTIDCFESNRVMWYNKKAAFYQNVEKTDVNQIYGEYYFSSNNERVPSVSEVEIDSRYHSNLFIKKTLPGNRQQPRVQQHL